MRSLNLPLGVLCFCFCFASYAQKPMSLSGMFAAADSLNATVRAADFEVQESLALVEAARNAYLPSIQASANVSLIGLGYSFDRNFSNAIDERLPIWGNNLAIQASQIVFVGGAITNGVKAAQIGSKLARVQADTNRDEVRYLIVATSLEITKLDNQLKALQSNIELTDVMLEKMRSRYDEGTVLQSDITRYELLKQDLEFNKVSIESAIYIMCSKLAIAVGLPAQERIIPVVDISTPSRDLIWDASESPVILGASLAAELSETKLAIAKAERLPVISLFAGESFNGPDVTTFISAKTAGYGCVDKNFNFATLGVQITYNLDSSYKSRAKIRQSEASLGKARANFDAARQEMDLALAAAMTEYHNAFARAEICDESEALAKMSYKLVADRYESGLATVTDFLDASTRKLESEIAAINARIDILAAYYKLRYICSTL